MVNDMTGLSSPRRAAAVNGCRTSTQHGEQGVVSQVVEPGPISTVAAPANGRSLSAYDKRVAAPDVVTVHRVWDVYAQGWRAGHAGVVAAVSLAYGHGGPRYAAALVERRGAVSLLAIQASRSDAR